MNGTDGGLALLLNEDNRSTPFESITLNPASEWGGQREILVSTGVFFLHCRNDCKPQCIRPRLA
jgi:hypothetical protein